MKPPPRSEPINAIGDAFGRTIVQRFDEMTRELRRIGLEERLHLRVRHLVFAGARGIEGYKFEPSAKGIFRFERERGPEGRDRPFPIAEGCARLAQRNPARRKSRREFECSGERIAGGCGIALRKGHNAIGMASVGEEIPRGSGNTQKAHG